MDEESVYGAEETLGHELKMPPKDGLFEACDAFFAFSWTPNEDVSTQIEKLSSLWSDINNDLKAQQKHKLPDLMLVCKTLNILPAEYEIFRSCWMLFTKDTEMTFDVLSRQLRKLETNLKKKTSNDVFPREELVVIEKIQKGDRKKKSRENISCNYCGKNNQLIIDCEKGHKDRRLPKIETTDDSQSYKNAQDDKSTYKNSLGRNKSKAIRAEKGFIISVSDEILNAEPNTTDWWIDKDAIRHVTNNLDFFLEFKKFKKLCGIKAIDKGFLQAIGKGTIKVMSIVNDEKFVITLNDVWYVPDIPRNLFSILAAQDKNKKSVFESTITRCSLKVNDKILLSGIRDFDETVFKATIDPIFPSDDAISQTAPVGSSQLQLYHERWGHQDKQHVKNLLQKKLGINVKMDQQICEPCVYGKARRSKSTAAKRPCKPGDLIFSDLFGPFDESFGKKRYLATFKDSYTKYRYSYTIRDKPDVTDALQSMIAHAKQQKNSIKEMVCIKGGDFDNVGVKEILQRNGITQKLTASYRIQKNGDNEQDNCKIVEMARTFKYSNREVKFPEAIWAELVTSATYVLNRTGKSSVDGVSPYELWIGCKPQISHLRIIASTCYVLVPQEKRKIMERKAIKGYLIGYDDDESYRIYIKGHHKVIVSKDVQFHELTRECKGFELSMKNPHFCKENVENSGKVVNKPKVMLENGSEPVDDQTAIDFEKELLQSVPSFSRKSRVRLKWKKQSCSREYASISDKNEDTTDTNDSQQISPDVSLSRESLQ